MNNINLTENAVKIIETLRHPAGTLDFYRNTLTRISNQILYCAEDFGMDDTEAIETLRALDMLRLDLAELATVPDNESDKDAPDEVNLNQELTQKGGA